MPLGKGGLYEAQIDHASWTLILMTKAKPIAVHHCPGCGKATSDFQKVRKPPSSSWLSLVFADRYVWPVSEMACCSPMQLTA